ncbi:hypothetical protein CASFOL_002504 [Castilleja foliolosa]|uniref:Uncharacterized protein n=1 Tax=Castilleja foliolosa TaxID=1961234 RepID=A0ABD3EEI6_9LAMI
MNKELVRVKREVGETMARKGDKRKKVGKSNLPKEVNDNTLSDKPGKSGEVAEEMLDVEVEEPEQERRTRQGLG